ncbi:GuaB1 family IMP dehydrogenase-related protein [Endothiovibrio diazotrophicus]
MKFLHSPRSEGLELSLSDVFLVPSYFEGTTRTEADLRPVDFPGSTQPLVSANMNAVTGRRMAESMARLGGLGILPQDMDPGTAKRIVRFIKQADPVYDTPLSVTLEATLRDIQGLILKRDHDLVTVVDERNRPQGIVSHSDISDRDQYSPVARVMNREIVTIAAGTPAAEAYELLERNRLDAAPVVDERGALCGVLTRNLLVRQELLKPSLDGAGRLMVGAAVGISADPVGRAEMLLEEGVDLLVLDTAHGHQKRMLGAIRAVREVVGEGFPLVAGNVCTAAGTRDLLEAGADAVKVNIGPGAMCTTRMMTGVGRPSFSTVLACARAAREMGKHVWADGGVKDPRDVALYLAAGASRVMVGTMLAGTYESPGDIRRALDGHLYKENHGMASTRAVQERSQGKSSFERAIKELYREGISSSHIRIRPGRESVGVIVGDIVTGLQSAFTYLGAANCREFFDNAVVGVQTPGGFEEGKPRGEL